MNAVGKPFREKSNPKNRTVKIRVKLPQVNKKSLARKRTSVQKPFYYSLKLEQKNSRRKTTHFFAPLPVSA